MAHESDPFTKTTSGQTFLLELGAGFSFVARPKRIQIDGDDFHIDLLSDNRKLKKLVIVELKQGRFKPEYKGQMELYRRWIRPARTGAGRESATGYHSLCREELGRIWNSRRRVSDCFAAAGNAPSEIAQGNRNGSNES
jgi:hypothetical protein